MSIIALCFAMKSTPMSMVSSRGATYKFSLNTRPLISRCVGYNRYPFIDMSLPAVYKVISLITFGLIDSVSYNLSEIIVTSEAVSTIPSTGLPWTSTGTLIVDDNFNCLIINGFSSVNNSVVCRPSSPWIRLRPAGLIPSRLNYAGRWHAWQVCFLLFSWDILEQNARTHHNETPTLVGGRWPTSRWTGRRITGRPGLKIFQVAQ